MKTATFKSADNFGTEVSVLDIDVINTANACVRFWLDGAVEGIADGILTGTVDEDALSFFGLI